MSYAALLPRSQARSFSSRSTHSMSRLNMRRIALSCSSTRASRLESRSSASVPRLVGGGVAEAKRGASICRSSALFRFRSEEHTSELQSLMRISYAVFCLKKKNNKKHDYQIEHRRQDKT